MRKVNFTPWVLAFIGVVVGCFFILRTFGGGGHGSSEAADSGVIHDASAPVDSGALVSPDSSYHGGGGSIRDFPLDESDSRFAYELIKTNFQCQLDFGNGGEPGVEGEVVLRHTNVANCSGFQRSPLTLREVYEAVTLAAEAGDVRAQMDYSLYASQIFADERSALDTELIAEYKRNVVRFLEAAANGGSQTPICG